MINYAVGHKPIKISSATKGEIEKIYCGDGI
jgi:hypothetical protein